MLMAKVDVKCPFASVKKHMGRGVPGINVIVQAAQFLQALYTEKEQFVFSSRISHEPVQQPSLTLFASKLRKKGKMVDIPTGPTPNSNVQGLARLKCPCEVAEAVLGHSRKGIEGTPPLLG
jgi:hypothetical protein